MPPSWDDDFDFDDLDSKPKKKEPKKPKKNEDDFFDLNDEPKNNSKLPVINPKAGINSSSRLNNNSSSRAKPTNIYDDYNDLEEEIEEVNSPKKPAVAPVQMRQPSEEDGLEDLDDIVPVPQKENKAAVGKEAPPEEEEYL